MVGIRMQDHVNKERNEGIGRGVGLFRVLQKAKNDLAAIQNADDLIPWCSVAINF
jgi:hypothetical protein